MNYFSISQLARYSGIKPHTIRVWEQRYNALTPNRSEGNTRYYDNQQLRRLLNIASLLESEYKVSELCRMPDQQLFSLVEELPEKTVDESVGFFVSQLVAAGMSYDEPGFDKIFSHCLLKYGVREVYIKVIYPMLQRVGIMWTTNALEPAAEHFISNLIRQKLFTVIDSLPAGKPDAEPWLLFLPENEFHEIGLLFASYLIRSSGHKVVYLGANVPLESLQMAAKVTPPARLLLFLAHNDLAEETEHYLSQLVAAFAGREICIAADRSLFEDIKVPANVRWLNSAEALEQLLKT